MLLLLGAAPAPPAPATASVTLANKAFSPSSVTIRVGGTVTWTNNDGAHNVTASGRRLSDGPTARTAC
jgi:plastocyanin